MKTIEGTKKVQGVRFMKIIEGMKKVKDLQRKAEDLRKKVAVHCADLDVENPVYGTVADQRAVVQGWIQAHSDILKEILKLRIAIQRTNLVTEVPINLGDKVVNKTIAEWIHRRRDLADTELMMWRVIGDRGLKDQLIPSTVAGAEPTRVNVRRYYDPKERDEMMSLYGSEATTIDATLEVANAVTDLLDLEA
jgi:hypothetical protein